MQRILAIVGVIALVGLLAAARHGQILNRNGNGEVSDADADTGIECGVADDRCSVYVNRAEDFRFTANTFTVLSGSSFVSTAGTNNINVITPTATSIDFTIQPQVPFFAKTTGAIMTEVDTQEDTFRVGTPARYFELFQDGNNSDNVGTWAVGAAGWTIPGPNAADQGTQLTEGIVLGSAHSFAAGTDAAFRIRAAFYVPTVAQIAALFAGFRALGAYAVADDSTEITTAYDDKVIAGVLGTGGASELITSVATSDVATACTHTAITDGKLLAVEVNVDAAGLTTHNFATATPAGTTTAQIQAAVATAYAALASDTDTACDAKAVTLTAGNYVPTIMWASAAGPSTVKLVNYYAGPQ